MEYSKKYYNIFSSNHAQNTFVYPINIVIRIMCQPGYELVGFTQLICRADEKVGVWNEKPPICRQGTHLYADISFQKMKKPY